MGSIVCRLICRNVPVAYILIKSTPAFRWSRIAATISSGLSAIMANCSTFLSIDGRNPVKFMCPPVILIAQPETNILGPKNIPSLIASRTAISAISAPSLSTSLIVVKPAINISFAALNASMVR